MLPLMRYAMLMAPCRERCHCLMLMLIPRTRQEAGKQLNKHNDVATAARATPCALPRHTSYAFACRRLLQHTPRHAVDALLSVSRARALPLLLHAYSASAICLP